MKNVEYGLIGSPWENADAEEKRRRVVEACKEAFADEYIGRLPMVGGRDLFLSNYCTEEA